MGHRATPVNVDEYIYGSVFTKLHYHLNAGPGVWSLNKKILSLLATEKYDILLVDNKTYLTYRTLQKIRNKHPNVKIANLLTDDPFGRYNKSWRLTIQTAALFDIHFVQRIENIQELKDAGARRVELCFRSYDPLFHRPVTLNEDDSRYKTPVGFVGTYEEERESFIAYLLQNNVSVKVTGDGWPKGKYWELIKPYYLGPSVYGEPYIKTINGMDIALHFLRKGNRDQQDSRSFEIPACGVFMLAERSHLHEQFFAEDKEAVFFDTKEELLNKVNYYLQHADDRKAIAAKGHERCIQSRYSHQGRLENVFAKIISLN